jgi:molybdenum cofactor cytidylyltransferase
VDEVILVLGAGAREKKKAIAGRPLRVVVNRDYRRGMSTSLITGLKLVDARAQRVMVALSDQPLVGSETYSRLAEASLGSELGIAVPVYRGARGNPIVFSMGYREELLGLSGDIGGREVVARHPDDVLEVAVSSEGVIVNINTMADYYSRLPREAKPGGDV